MKKILLLLLVSQNVLAGPYFEFGGFYSNDRLWVETLDGRFEESGVIGHVALGYVSEHFDGKLLLDTQYRHESDPKNSNQADLTSKDSLGMSARFFFW